MHLVRKRVMIQKTVFVRNWSRFWIILYPNYHMKILLGYFNAKLGRKDIFKPTTGNMSLHQDSNSGVRIVNFATPKNLAVTSKMFPHQNIHKYTWTSPHGKTHNQISHTVRKVMAFEYTRCTIFQGSCQ
jgi:hypothetical protein